jgi:CheY-like chemotaxis protein
MTNTLLPDQPFLPSDDFVGNVKLALANLYHLPQLQKVSQSESFINMMSIISKSREPSGQLLRRLLIETIERLNPGVGVFFRSPLGRLYNLMHLHYVERMTIQECLAELGISERQAYRDLKQGTETIAQMLWATLQSAQEPTPNRETVTLQIAQVSSIHAEISRLHSNLKTIDISQLIQHASNAIELLASQKLVEIDLHLVPLWITTDPLIAQNVLVNLFSHAVSMAITRLSITLEVATTSIDIVFTWQPEIGTDPNPPIEPNLYKLADQLHWTMQDAAETKEGRIRLNLMGQGSKVLIIDDNEGLIDLLARYLAELHCRVLTATDGQTGFNLALSTHPDVIILDVMMPNPSGWEVLQKIRNDPRTSELPVVICSIFNNPALAYALGASHVIVKPVQQEDILNALVQLKVF